MKVHVITVSDRASKGIYEDLSGPEIRRILEEELSEKYSINPEISGVIVPDEIPAIAGALENNGGADFIITTGGTGLSDRDVTPEATEMWYEKELPGIAEILRAESYKETPMAMLSRGTAGIKGRTIVVNFPGSLKGVRLCTKVFVPVMTHAIGMIRGEGH